MGFVVYKKDNFRAVGYYEREASAKSQVTRHNKAYVIDLLKGNDYCYDSEYEYCSWTDFETILKQGHIKGGLNYHNF